MALLSNNNAFQSAWVVADFEAAVDFWVTTYGVGPFFGLDWQSSPELQYRGEPGTLDMKVAWGQAGDMQIELIQPTSEAPNVYRDLVAPGETSDEPPGLEGDPITSAFRDGSPILGKLKAAAPHERSENPDGARPVSFIEILPERSLASFRLVEGRERALRL